MSSRSLRCSLVLCASVALLLLSTSSIVHSQIDVMGDVQPGSPYKIHAVVYLLDFCGWKNPFRNATEFKRYMFANQPGGSVEGNLQHYYETCSYGKVAWNPNNVAVVGPLTINCTGSYANGKSSVAKVDLSKACGGLEQLYWAVEANAQAAKLAEEDTVLAGVLQWQTRRRILMMLPREAPCSFGGLGDVGCNNTLSATKTCTALIKGTRADRVSTIFHEVQHNSGLQHSSRDGQEYGDTTDPMGNTTLPTNGVHCHNAPNNWKLGWAGPVPGGDLTASRFTPSSNRLQFTIPASSVSDKNMVIVDLGLGPRTFLSYRVRNTSFGGFDAALEGAYNQKVLVHSFAGTQAEADRTATVHVATLPRSAGDYIGTFQPYVSATGLGGGLRVKVLSVGPTSARVELCRMFSQTEGAFGSPECDVGLDLDCDGLYGNADPDCKAAPPPPPRPPTKPPPPPQPTFSLGLKRSGLLGRRRREF